MNLNEQFRIISIFHYVVGGFHALFGSFGLIHFFMGLMFVLNPAMMEPRSAGAPPVAWIGWVFVLVGGGWVLFGWTLGLCTILSGRYIAQRRKRIFSIVVASVNCAMVPFGTVLGIFTLILLTRDDVRALYGEPGGGPA